MRWESEGRGAGWFAPSTQRSAAAKRGRVRAEETRKEEEEEDKEEVEGGSGRGCRAAPPTEQSFHCKALFPRE